MERARTPRPPGLRIVYDKTYPPATTDFAPIVRAIQATNPDIVVICSYPPDSVGMVQRHQRDRLQAEDDRRRHGRPADTSIKAQLGPLLNGFINYDFWLPVPKMDFPGVADLMKKYQAKAPAEASIRSATTLAPLGLRADARCWSRRSQATKSLDDNKLADYIRATTFKTVLGDVKFGKDGEWAQ